MERLTGVVRRQYTQESRQHQSQNKAKAPSFAASCWCWVWSVTQTWMSTEFCYPTTCLCSFLCPGILKQCSLKNRDVSSVFEVTLATMWRMGSFYVHSASVLATLLSLCYHTHALLTTGKHCYSTIFTPDIWRNYLLTGSLSSLSTDHPSLEIWLKTTTQQIAALQFTYRRSPGGQSRINHSRFAIRPSSLCGVVVFRLRGSWARSSRRIQSRLHATVSPNECLSWWCLRSISETLCNRKRWLTSQQNLYMTGNRAGGFCPWKHLYSR